jgi:hypothetical protein
MVHALREAHRVLRSGGILIDLRPAAVHRRVGVGRNRRWRLVGVMRETFEEDRAADQSVAQVVRDGLFRRGAHAEFLLEREMDTLDDLRTWLTEFGQRRALATHDWLIRKVARVRGATEATIVGRGPVKLNVLRKLD